MFAKEENPLKMTGLRAMEDGITEVRTVNCCSYQEWWLMKAGNNTTCGVNEKARVYVDVLAGRGWDGVPDRQSDR